MFELIPAGIVELHMGTITATSSGLGCGCTITVELPAVRRIQISSAHPIHVSASMDSLLSISYEGNDIERIEGATTPSRAPLSKVLVVDDSGPTRKMLTRSRNTMRLFNMC